MVTRDVSIAVSEQVRDIVRLLMKRPITEEIALEIKAVKGFEHLEIMGGDWVGLDKEWDEMTTGEEHGSIEFLLLFYIGGHVLAHQLGRVYPGDVTFVLDGEPGNIIESREADVGFVAESNVQSTQGFIFCAPDLAIEIVSPSQSEDEMRAKAKLYLRYGTKQSWVVIPDTRQIEVHLPDDAVKVYNMGDVIPGGDVLPGFTLKVDDVFKFVKK